MELFRLQGVLCRHGVQLPREFTLLIKCLGRLSGLDVDHRGVFSMHIYIEIYIPGCILMINKYVYEYIIIIIVIVIITIIIM